MDKVEKQKCPVCLKDTLTLTEDSMEIPFFGRAFIFSMECQEKECNYRMSDVEAEEEKEPTRYTLEIKSDKDMSIRIVKSANATVKIPQLKMSMEPGVASVGFVSNVEGVLDKFKKVIEDERDATEDDEIKDNAKKLLKKIWKVKLGDLEVKLIIEDETGNSAIISDKAVVEKLRKK